MDKLKKATDKEISNFKKKLGKNIQKYREAAGLTQSKLAEGIGVATSSIGMSEIGKTQPRSTTLYRIAKYLGIEVQDLFTFDNTNSSTEKLLKIKYKLDELNKLF